MSSNLDEYLGGADYQGHKPENDGFSRFEKNGEFYFGYYDKSGKLMLRSQGYKGAAGRDNGIESVKKNRKIDEHWKVKEDGGKWYLVLIAGNKQEIARSVSHNSKGAAEGLRSGGSSSDLGKIAGAGAGAGIVSNLSGDGGKIEGKIISETRGDAKEISRGKAKEVSRGEAKEVGRRELKTTGEAKEISRGEAKEVSRGKGKEISRGKGKEVERRVVNETRREIKSTPVYKEKVVAPPPKPKPAPVKKAAPVKKVAAAAAAPVAASSGCFKWWMLLPLLLLIPLLLWAKGCFAPAAVVVPPPVVAPVPPPPPPPAPAVVPPPVIAAVCPNDCEGSRNAVFNIPKNTRARKLPRLGSNPEFGNVHNLSPTQFYEKLKKAYETSAVDKRFLDGIYKEMGYDDGFAEAAADQFSSVRIDRGQKGNIGFSKAHKTLYVQLNTTGKDLDAFRIKAANGCHLNFMKTCGNHFYFCPKVES